MEWSYARDCASSMFNPYEMQLGYNKTKPVYGLIHSVCVFEDITIMGCKLAPGAQCSMRESLDRVIGT